MDIAVQTHELCKSYVTRQVALPTLFHALRQKWFGPQPSSVGSVPAYALQHISIEVQQGGSLGIIGDNGSGKTTLLKTIAGLYPPSAGSVMVNGVLAFLSSSGMGVMGELSVADNVFLLGAIYGIDRQVIQDKFHEILAWAELEKYTAAEFRTLSSGIGCLNQPLAVARFSE